MPNDLFREVLMDAATSEPKPAYWHLSQDVRDAIVLLLEFVTIFVYQQTCFPSQRSPSDSDSSAGEHSEDEEEESHSWDKAKQFTTLLSEWCGMPAASHP